MLKNQAKIPALLKKIAAYMGLVCGLLLMFLGREKKAVQGQRVGCPQVGYMPFCGYLSLLGPFVCPYLSGRQAWLLWAAEFVLLLRGRFFASCVLSVHEALIYTASPA